MGKKAGPGEPTGWWAIASQLRGQGGSRPPEGRSLEFMHTPNYISQRGAEAEEKLYMLGAEEGY